MKLGVDFGSSTSYFSTWNPMSNAPQTIMIDPNGIGVPTVAAVPETGGEWEFGSMAREQLAGPGYKHFRACKMLLNAKPEEWKKHDDYSDAFTPERIAKGFLEKQITRALEECEESAVERMVICIPELWAKGIRFPDPKETLYQICRKIPQVKDGGGNVEIVTEPEAASAYTAYCCRGGASGQKFEGCLLIIDYGGGTLDITLTEVDTVMQAEKEITRVSTRVSCGVGENHDGKIGAAGITYMTRVTEMLLCSACPEVCDPLDSSRIDPSRRMQVVESPLFVNLYRKVETAVIGGKNRLKRALDRCSHDIKGEMPGSTELINVIWFSDFQGNNVSASLTAGMLYRAYTDTIEPVLERELNKLKPSILKFVSNAYEPDCRNFKIVLVGGFGKFLLVEQQVQSYFRVMSPEADCRLDTRLANQRETAISFGAALIANDEVTVRRTAPLSLGIFGYVGTTRTYYNAIVYGQIMEDDTVYYVRRDPSPDEPEKDIVRVEWDSSDLVEFALYFTDDQNKAYSRKMKKEYWKNNIVIPKGMDCALGFRIDNSSVISMVIREFIDKNHVGELFTELRLNCYEEIFEGFSDVRFATEKPFDRLNPNQ